jgi:hypothetical protein
MGYTNQSPYHVDLQRSFGVRLAWQPAQRHKSSHFPMDVVTACIAWFAIFPCLHVFCSIYVMCRRRSRGKKLCIRDVGLHKFFSSRRVVWACNIVLYFAVNLRYEKWQRRLPISLFPFDFTARGQYLSPTSSSVMVATLAYAAGETAAALSLSRDGLRGTWPPPSHFGFLRGAAAERVAKEEGPASAWVELEPICSEQQLDQVLAEAQQLDLPIVLLW